MYDEFIMCMMMMDDGCVFIMEQVNVEIVGQSSSSQTTEFSSVVDGSMWSSDGGEPVPETVTVTLTQKPGDGRYLTQKPGNGTYILL